MSRDLTEALHALMQQREANIMPAPQARGAAPQAKSAALLPGGGGAGNGGGTYTENSFTAREWWPNKYTSTDGLFFLPAIKKVVMTDSAGKEVTFNFAEPTT